MKTINTIKKEVFFDTDIKDMKVLLSEYKKRLHDEVEPEKYVKYILQQQRGCDYIDIESIVIAVTHVYPNVSKEQVRQWVTKYK